MKNLIIGTLAVAVTAFATVSFTSNKEASYEYKIVTVVESIVPKGLGRSRIIEHQQKTDYKTMTSQNVAGQKKERNKADRGAAKIDNYSETKILNFFSAVGINFQNIASNDALVTSKINDMINSGWELSYVNTGVESDAGNGDGFGMFITRLTFKKAK